VFANPTKNRFRRKALAWDALESGIRSTCSNVGAAAARGVGARRQIGRPILVCRWVAVDGRLECRWSIEVRDGCSIEEPQSSLWSIGRPLAGKRFRYRQAVLAVG
jgi:hypothetical protein